MRLIVEKGPGSGRMFPIDVESVAGRLPSCRIALPDNKVSREHARFFVSAGAVYVADLGSSNGTFVNGHRISSPVRLASGDEVVIGETTLRFKEEAAPNAPPADVASPPLPATPASIAVPRPPAASHAGEIGVKHRILQFSKERDRPADGLLIQDLSQRGWGFRALMFLLAFALVAALTYAIAGLVASGGSSQEPRRGGDASPP